MDENKNEHIPESQEGDAVEKLDNLLSKKDPLKDKPSGTGKRSYKGIRRVFLISTATIFIAIVAFLGYLATDLPPMNLIENPESDLSTQLISADGVVLSRYYSRENRVNVKLNEVSPYVINGLIATEDVRFYGHSGVDPKSFFTILKDVILGDDVRGGSTITMQLSRNLYDEVGNESVYIRKLKEYLVSAYIERKFTKEEIMMAYLNTVNIWGTSYGIETTSRRLFDKAAKDLAIEEAALVVGMLKGQGVYNPFRYPERTQKRRNVVLTQMAKYGMIDSSRYSLDSLKSIPLSASLKKQEQEHTKGLAPYFREHIRGWLKTWCKENGHNLYTEGLKVYTSIDSRMQTHAEAAVREHLMDLQKTFDKVERRGERLFSKDAGIVDRAMKRSRRYRNAKKAGKTPAEIAKEFRTKVPMKIFTWEGEKKVNMAPMDSLKHYLRYLQTGMMSMDPTNGHVKAWVGGIDFKYFKYDQVAKGKRQVGSTFKPFVYGRAISGGYEPCTELLNQPVTFENVGGGRWTPKNSDGSIGGKMTLRMGLATSTNIITAQLMKDLGPPSVVDFAHKMGIKSKLDAVPALCLGVTDLSVLEMVNAYSTFANMGTRIEPILVTRIEDRNGEILWQAKTEAQEVLERDKAFLIVELLKGVVDLGTGRRLRFKYKFRNEIGGKTGTTQNQSDGWFMGITPQLVTGVWVGASDRRVHFRSIKYGQGANMALPIWALYMQKVQADTRINGLLEAHFERPDGLTVDLSCKKPVKDEDGGDDHAPSADDFDDFE
ncbi:MAG: transglycosylase domain-containing protein [Bacteroidia bacterium]|nr:transglycosylase domain-containing protein [Bacteroidia bacterium]